MARKPEQIDSEAEKLLEENGWKFDGTIEGYRNRKSGKVISYEELDHHGLAPHPQDSPDERKRRRGIEWLRKRVG